MSEECYFKIRNFEDFQHYSKRNPPWIRLYYRLLSDRRFYRLSDSNKYLIIGLFLLASQHQNKIAADPDWIIKELSLETDHPDWQSIVDSQFILPINCDASMLLRCLTKTCSHIITDNSDNSEGIPEILSLSPKTVKGSVREAIEVLNCWNSQTATIHHRRLDGQEKAIRKTLQRYSPDEIKRAIERYGKVRLNSDGKYRDVYSWTLGEFLTRHDCYNLERLTAENWETPFLTQNRDRHETTEVVPESEIDHEALKAALDLRKALDLDKD